MRPPGRVCTGCKVYKPWSDFHKSTIEQSGHSYCCKKCRSERGAKSYQKNKEARRASHRAWSIKHPHKPAEYARAYRQRHPERAQASRIEQYNKNKDDFLERNRKWYKDHKEWSALKSAKRRATGSLTVMEWREILGQYGGCCASCGSTKSIERDHIVPVSLGGKTEPENMQPLCRSCNALKSVFAFDFVEAANQTLR